MPAKKSFISLCFLLFLSGGYCWGQKSFDEIIKPYENNTKKDTTFYKAILIENKSIGKQLKESPLIFENIFFFTGCTFKQQTLLSNITFKGPVNFEGTTFQELVRFDNANFEKSVFFSNINVKSKDAKKPLLEDVKPFGISFENLKFKDDVQFEGAKLSKVNFKNITFKKAVTFTNAKFSGNTSFENTTFNTLVRFTNAKFVGKNNVSFKNTFLPDILYFDNVDLSTFEGIIDFSQAKLKNPDKPCKIYLINTDVSKIRMQYTQFQLFFPLSEHISIEKKLQVQKLLLARLRSDGLTEGVKKLDIETKRLYTLNQFSKENIFGIDFWRIGEIKNKINYAWWEFGYNREKVLICASIMLLIFWLINFLYLPTLLSDVYDIKGLKKRHNISRIHNGMPKNPNRNKKKLKVFLRGLRLFFFFIFYLVIFILLVALIKFFYFLANSKPKKRIFPKYIRYFMTRFYLSFFYTSYIFFTLRIELTNLHYEGRWWPIHLLYFFSIYLAGLTSLAYLVGYVVISR